VIQLTDGSFLLAGPTESYGVARSDFWLVKLDSTGQHEWNNTFGGYQCDEVYSLIQTLDSGYLLAGVSDSVSISRDIWLVKTDANGQKEWDENFGGESDDIGNSVIQLTDGSFVIAGVTESFGAGAEDMWLLKVQVSEGSTSTTTTTDSATFPGFLFLLGSSGLLVYVRKKRRP
jgi:hypothetical protein